MKNTPARVESESHFERVDKMFDGLVRDLDGLVRELRELRREMRAGFAKQRRLLRAVLLGVFLIFLKDLAGF